MPTQSIQREQGSPRLKAQSIPRKQGSQRLKTQSTQREQGSPRLKTQSAPREQGSLRLKTQSIPRKQGPPRLKTQSIPREQGSQRLKTQSIQREQRPPRLKTQSIRMEQGTQSIQRKQGSSRLPSERKPSLTSAVPQRTPKLNGDRSFPRHNSPTRSNGPLHQEITPTSTTGANVRNESIRATTRLPQYPTEVRNTARTRSRSQTFVRSRYQTDNTPSPSHRQRKPTTKTKQPQTAFQGPELSPYLLKDSDRNHRVSSSSGSTSIKPTVPQTSNERSRNQQLPLLSIQNQGLSSSGLPSHQSESLPEDPLYPQHLEGSAEQNPSQHMCYWCAIKIVQENTFASSGPNHMPVGIGSQSFSQQALVNDVSKVETQLDNVGFRRSNKDVRIANLREIESDSAFDLPSTVSAEFRTKGERILWNPQTSPSQYNPLLSSFNRIFSERKATNNTNLKPGPFFKPSIPESDDTSVGLVEATDVRERIEVDQDLSTRLSAHLPTYLEYLSTLHGLYPSALSTADKHLADSRNYSASVALLHSDPLKTYLTSVDAILQKNLHQEQSSNPKVIELQEPEASARKEQTAVVNNLQKNDAKVGHPHIQKSLLLDAWWRLRLYLHVGHDHPWIQV